jgi:hypothetical protein
MRIELLYLAECPHYEAFAEHVTHLLEDQRIASPLERVRVRNSDDAERLRFLGSPSLRVNGTDVESSAAERTDYGMQCRLYHTSMGFHRTPPDDLIVAALSHLEHHDGE